MTKFEKTVRSMSIKEIILAMVESLINPTTEIDMGSFGYIDIRKSICYGCAATNTICRIGNFDLDDLLFHKRPYATEGIIARCTDLDRVSLVHGVTNTPNNSFLVQKDYFVGLFESMIDSLRRGKISLCNRYLKDMNLPLIIISEHITLPCLDDDYSAEQLNQYIKLAHLQK